MRHIISVFFFSLVFGLTGYSSAHAQDYSAGLKIGVSTTTFSGNSLNELKWRSAFAGGFVFGAAFGDMFKIQPEAIYTVKGASIENVVIDDEPTRLDAVFSIAYIDIPVLLHFYPVEYNSIYPKIFIGPMLSYQLDAQVKTIEPGGASQTESDDTVDGSDYGIVIGGGVDFDFRGERITFDARYLFGQSNIRSSRPDAPLNNRGVVVMMGVSF